MVRVAGICRDLNWPDGVKGEVIEAIEYEQRILERVNRHGRGLTFGYLIAFFLLILAAALILTIPGGVLAWFIAAFILYSFNFIILFLPTTKKGPRDESCRRVIGWDSLRPVFFLLRHRPRLAIEVGITIFLGGMVPLAVSFFILFGTGVFMALYFIFFQGAMDTSLGWIVIFQASIIVLFFMVVVLAEPQSQGFTRIARAFKARYDIARERGLISQSAILVAAGLVAVGIGLLFTGAILLTGSVLGRVIAVGSTMGLNISFIILILVIQVVIMRHFQVVFSRRMAKALLELRLEVLRSEVLEPLNKIVTQAKYTAESAFDKRELERIKSLFFNVVLYEVFELNFFGYSPVFVIGPNVKYIIDERVLPYLGKS
ncbi:MAG: hypothetical protein QW520_01630 [Methanomassiliicoccales archaeon]